jgi:hypothetical protein
MGMIPMIHCKSGTNRTSRAVEEAKLLIAEIDSNVQKYSEGRFLGNNLVPLWGKLDQPRERAAAAFFVGVGTQELQQTNSGDAGSSEGHSVTKRIPSFKKAIEQYKGVYADWKKALMKSYRSNFRSA